MPDYSEQEPKQIEKKVIIEKVVHEERSLIDLAEMANLIAKAVSDQMPKQQIIQTIQGPHGSTNIIEDNFDTSKTMNKLAEQMLIERGNSESNFSDLGNVKETKKDQKEVDNTIDLLSDLDD